MIQPFQSSDLLRAAEPLIQLAKDEDLGDVGDLTSQLTIPRSAEGKASIVSRADGILCGGILIPKIVEEFNADVDVQSLIDDGQKVPVGAEAVRLTGATRDLLTIERTILNFVGKLSGIASLTAEYVKAIEGTAAEILDTRKTTPGWRRLEKYAVHCGGGTNHRMGLFDAVLIKDNHLAASGVNEDDWLEAVNRAIHDCRQKHPALTIQVEVDSLDQFERVLPLEPDIILLDNMTPDQLRLAVQLREDQPVLLEASGGITLSTVRTVAESGVDRISVGALTHSAVNMDWGLDWQF